MTRQLRKKGDIGFSAISVVGGLISPDKIAQIAAASPDAKTAESYACPKGTSLRDEIARYFRIGQAEWQSFSRTESQNFEQCTAFAKALLEGAFGFQSLQGPKRHHDDGHSYTISLEAKNGRIPIVVAPPALEDNQDAFKIAYSQFGDAGGGRNKRRPDALLQEWLNASEPALWGLVFAGDRLRLLRDNASFTRPAYIEADLGAIFRDEMFADFTALWLLIHATRFGNEGAAVSDCALERWREEGVESGTAARDRLRENVEEALLSLGQGFLDGNPDLRDKLDSGTLSDQRWFEQLLRIVYRLIFIAVTEERDLLHEPEAKPAIRTLYSEGYSFAHMRERSTRRTLRDPHGDVWEGARILFRALDKGQAKLGLPALGGIFDESLTPDLGEARIANKHFLNAIYRLSFIQDEKTRVRINWRDMATEELGSVYEGLLELVPTRINHGRDFAFAGGDEARGNARKTSGSYYTPDSLVQALLDSALDPVLDKAEANGGADAILDLTVIDPACGSAHFLLGAARRMAERVAKLRDSENPDFQHALRDVVRRCIYGVDRNPMAVELAKVALWIEAVEPGKPLGFLDANIRCGDSLLGVFDLEVLRQGIPDAAYKDLTGDDKAIAKDLARKNKAEREGQATFEFAGGSGSLPPPPPIGEVAVKLRAMPEETPRQVSAKAKAFDAFETNQEFIKWRHAAELYLAAYLAPKTKTDCEIPTTGHVWRALTNRLPNNDSLARGASNSAETNPFHWPLEFPDVMSDGGFSVVVGNPPWEVIQLSEQEFFSTRDSEIAAKTGNDRKNAIEALATTNPELHSDYTKAKRYFESCNEFVRHSGRFPHTAVGKINTYAIFSEMFVNLTSAEGRAGIIVPMGIATDSNTAGFFKHLLEGKRIASLFSFYEIRQIFKGTDDRNSFCLLTIASQQESAQYCALLKSIAELSDSRRMYRLSEDEIARINPNTYNLPVFRTEYDARLTAKIYAKVPAFVREHDKQGGNPWCADFRQGIFNITTDSRLFTKEPSNPSGPNKSLPVYEAKMVYQYDHRASSFSNANDWSVNTVEQKQRFDFEPTPRYWVSKAEVTDRLKTKGWNRDWLLGWRDITNATSERTVLSCIIGEAACVGEFSLILPDATAEMASLIVANLNSIPLDFVARNKISGNHLKQFHIKQLPLIAPHLYSKELIDFIVPRVLKLSFTSQSILSFAQELGWIEGPYVWDNAQRAQLRTELDAVYARAYGLSRDELRYILDPTEVKGADYPSETFRVLKEKEIKEHGEYRTARLVLAAWDQFERDGTFKELGLGS